MSESFTPPTTKIEILSQAAIIAGNQEFNTVDGGGAFSRDGDAIIDSLVSAELGSNRWRFARHSLEISSFTTLTPTFDGWQYYFPVPSDCLMLTSLYPFVDYEVYGNKILTRTDQTLTAKYLRNVPVSEWNPSFAFYMVWHLASILAVSVTQSDRMMARIEQGAKYWESRALFADGQSTRPRRFRSNPWVDVRYQFRNRRR